MIENFNAQETLILRENLILRGIRGSILGIFLVTELITMNFRLCESVLEESLEFLSNLKLR
jgi:hypothetical protein